MTALLCVDGSVAWTDCDGLLWVLSSQGAEFTQLPDIGHIDGACALKDRQALFGGDGGLLFYDLESKTGTIRRLREYGVLKPGRKILNVERVGPAVFVTGTNRLLLKFHDEGLIELLEPGSLRETTLAIFHVAVNSSATWVSGLLGTKPCVARVQGGKAEVFQNLPLGEAAPALASYRGRVFVGSSSVLSEEDGKWNAHLELEHAGDSVSRFGEMNGALVVMSEQGECHRLEDRWQTLPDMPR